MFRNFPAVMVVLLACSSLVLAAPKQPATKPAPPEPMKIDLPAGAIAFHFGERAFDGFKRVPRETAYSDDTGFGFTKPGDLSNTGDGHGWPTTYHISWVYPETAAEFQFKAKVPNGKYLAHLTYAPIIRFDATDGRLLLKVNDWTIINEHPTPEEYSSEKYLFRFMNTQYSEKPDAVWNNYLKKMYVTETHEINVTDGAVTLDGVNHSLFALILLPAENKEQFDAMTKQIETKMLDSYHSGEYYGELKQTKPQKKDSDGDYVLYVPPISQTIMPWTGPTDEDRKQTSLDLAGVPGQRVATQIAVVPFAELGQSTLELSDLKGEGGVIPAAQIKGHFKNYRYGALNPRAFARDDGRPKLTEMVLLPTLTLEMEPAITQDFWLWMQIPADAKPGKYTGEFTFKPGNGKPTAIPVQVEVYPFKLQTTLPLALGMYGTGIDPPMVTPEVRRKLLRERMDFVRSLGMTAITVGAPRVVKGAGGSLEMKFDPTSLQVAKEAGLGAAPSQTSMIENLCLLGRYVGYWMPGSPGGKAIDAKPGSELKLPDFDTYFLKMLGEYKAVLDSTGMPIVANIVDEPREKQINPWNRNFDDTMAYINLVRKAGGWKIAENPMYDKDHYTNKDYTPFIDAVDLISTHAWKNSANFIADTVAKGKTLWLYNVGMDRYTWGFYNWKVGSQGRWEWHFCFPEEDSFRNYKGAEWYNPFETANAYGPPAPYTKYPGGMLYQSAFLTASEGITDATYIYTLEQAIQSDKAAGKASAAVQQAGAFLAKIKAEMPAYPSSPNLMSGAEVGHAEEDKSARSTEGWRRQIAEFLKALQ